MKDDTEYEMNSNDALLTLIDPLEMESELDFIIIDYPDYITQRDDNVCVDFRDLLEFEF